MKRLHAFLLALALVWPVVAGLLPAGAEQAAERLMHALEHGLTSESTNGRERGHAHEADAALHVVAQADGSHHHVLDGAQPVDLPAALAAPPAVWRVSARAPRPEPPMPASAELQRLLRPPRAFQG